MCKIWVQNQILLCCTTNENNNGIKNYKQIK